MLSSLCWKKLWGSGLEVVGRGWGGVGAHNCEHPIHSTHNPNFRLITPPLTITPPGWRTFFSRFFLNSNPFDNFLLNSNPFDNKKITFWIQNPFDENSLAKSRLISPPPNYPLIITPPGRSILFSRFFEFNSVRSFCLNSNPFDEKSHSKTTPQDDPYPQQKHFLNSILSTNENNWTRVGGGY